MSFSHYKSFFFFSRYLPFPCVTLTSFLFHLSSDTCFWCPTERIVTLLLPSPNTYQWKFFRMALVLEKSSPCAFLWLKINLLSNTKGRINTSFPFYLLLHCIKLRITRTKQNERCIFWAAPRESSSIKKREGKNTINVPKMPCYQDIESISKETESASEMHRQ